MSEFKFLGTATNTRSGRASNRVLRCEATGETFPLATIAGALAKEFNITDKHGDQNARGVMLRLNIAARTGKTAFGHNWTLVSGTPYSDPKPRGPRKQKTSLQAVKKKAG